MNGASPKININLESSLFNLLMTRALFLGISINEYLRALAIHETGRMAEETPLFSASPRTDRRAKKAIEDINRSIKVDDLKQYFSSF